MVVKSAIVGGCVGLFFPVGLGILGGGFLGKKIRKKREKSGTRTIGKYEIIFGTIGAIEGCVTEVVLVVTGIGLIVLPIATLIGAGIGVRVALNK